MRADELKPKCIYPQCNGRNCSDCIEAGWRTSSFTNGGGACVAVKRDLNGLRDSKHPGPVLSVQVRGLIEWTKR